MVATKDDLDALAHAVTRRRWALGLTQRQATERAGVSGTLWSEVERGVRENLSPAAAYKIEVALDWNEGTVAALLRGERMLTVPEEEPMDANQRIEQLERRLGRIEELVDALLGDVRARLNRAISLDDPEGPDDEP